MESSADPICLAFLRSARFSDSLLRLSVIFARSGTRSSRFVAETKTSASTLRTRIDPTNAAAKPAIPPIGMNTTNASAAIANAMWTAFHFSAPR